MAFNVKSLYGGNASKANNTNTKQSGFNVKSLRDQVFEIKLSDNKTITNISYDAKKAIENNTLDSYIPKNDAEKKSLETYKKWVGYGKTYDAVKSQYDTDKYGKGNIDLSDRPIYKNEDGTISTVASYTMGIDGKQYVLPSIVRDENGTPKMLKTEDEVFNHFKNTGEYLGVFDTQEEADEYAQSLHIDQDLYYSRIPVADKSKTIISDYVPSAYSMTKDEYNRRRQSNASLPEFGSYEYFKNREESLRPIMDEIANDLERKDDTKKAWVDNYLNDDSWLADADENTRNEGRAEADRLSKKFKYQDAIIAEYRNIDEQLKKFEHDGVHYDKDGNIDTKSGSEEAKYARERYDTMLSADAFTDEEMALGFKNQLPTDKQEKYNTGESTAKLSAVEYYKEKAYNDYEKNKDKVYEDDFGGRATGGYKLGRININKNDAMSASFDAGIRDLESADVYNALSERIQKNNYATFQNNTKGQELLSTLSQYAPQAVDQLTYEVIGIGVGLATGTYGIGNLVGASGSAGYMYRQTAGSSFERLLRETDLSVEDAKKLAESEALSSSVVEFGLSAATGLLWKTSNLATKGATKRVVSGLSENVTKRAVSSLMAKGISEKGANIIVKTAINAGKITLDATGEGIEEWLQEGMSITTDRYAKEGKTASAFDIFLNSLDLSQYSSSDFKRMNQSFLAGAIIGLGHGGFRATTSSITNKVIRNVADAVDAKAVGKQIIKSKATPIIAEAIDMIRENASPKQAKAIERIETAIANGKQPSATDIGVVVKGALTEENLKPAISVGDTFEDAKTGKKITIKDRTDTASVVEIDTCTKKITKKMGNLWLDELVINDRYKRIENTENVSDTISETDNVAVDVQTEQSADAVLKGNATAVTDAINETLTDGAIEEIFESMKGASLPQDISVFAENLIDIYNDTGNIGHMAKYFKDGGKKVISVIEGKADTSEAPTIERATTTAETVTQGVNVGDVYVNKEHGTTHTIVSRDDKSTTYTTQYSSGHTSTSTTDNLTADNMFEYDTSLQKIKDGNTATVTETQATPTTEKAKSRKTKSKKKSVAEESSSTQYVETSEQTTEGQTTQETQDTKSKPTVSEKETVATESGEKSNADNTSVENESVAQDATTEREENGNARRSSLLSGDSRRNADGSTRKQNRKLSGFERKNKGKNAKERRDFTGDLIKRGQVEKTTIGNHTFNRINTEAYNDDMVSMVNEAKRKGVDLVFFVGSGESIYTRKDGTKVKVPFKGLKLNSTQVFVQYDHSISPQKIAKHEIIHAKWNSPDIKKVKDAILDSLTEEDKQEILSTELYQRYYEVYDGNKEIVLEEFACDVMSGLNDYTADYIDTVTDYWYGNETTDTYKVAEYSESIDAGGKIRHSLSSIGASFFGDETITSEKLEKMLDDGSYKEWQGYQDYVNRCVEMYQQSRGISKMSKKLQESLIEKPLYGIMRVAVASAKAGYNIIDNGKQRSTRDSQNRLLFTSLEPNSDYVTSSDISTICDKRTNFSEIYDEIVRLEEERGVPADKRFFKNIDNYFILHKIMADKGLTIPCEECYVESMRKNLGKMADSFIKLIKENDENNKSNDQLYHQKGKDKGKLKTNNATKRTEVRRLLAENDVLSIDDITVEMLTTAKGLTTLRLQAPDVYEQFNAFYGQAKPKLTREATPFRFGELTALLTKDDGTIDTALVKEIVSTGGFRLQSYSDFQIKNYVDVLQTLFEASMLGLNGHAYTKVPAFLEATNGTNLKRNISIFMYEDGGTWNLDKKNSFPMELEDIYALVASDESGNTSIIAVSQNADMSAWVMANDLVGYGIPFHKSGLKMEVVRGRVVKTPDGREILGYANEIDHTKQQSEVYKKTVSAKEKANTKVKKPIDIYSLWDFEGDAKKYQQLKKAHDEGKIDDSQYQKGIETMRKKLIEKNIKAYIDECDSRNYRPKFRAYVMNNGKLLNKILEYAKELGYVSQDATVDDISFKYGEYTIPYGYYKFLGDFGMFKPDGTASPIEPLSLENYDFDKAVDFFKDSAKLRLNELLQQFENGKVREDYRKMVEKGELTVEQLENIAKEKRSEVAQDVLEGRYSLAEEDAEYLELAKNPEKNEARLREMVDEVAKANGYRVAGHHGTDNRFTVFDRSKTNDANDFGQGFYFTSSEVEAQKYQNDDAFGDTYNKIYNVAYDNALEKIEESGEDANDDSIFTPIFNDEFDKELKRRSDEGAVINAYLKMDNPFVVSTSNWITKDEAIDIAKNTMYAENFPDESAISDWIHSIESYAKQHDGKVDTHQFANNMGHAISLTKALLHQGKYDGILDYSVGKKFNTTADYHAIALYPSKIKDSSLVTYDNKGNVIPLSQRFNKDNEDIRYSVADYAPTFYSQMGKVIDEMKQDKIGAKDVVRYLTDPKRGVKAEEIKWSGIEEFLESKKSVTKAELQEFVANNQLQIEEITLDNGEIPYTQEQTEQIAEYESQRNEIFEELKREWKKAIGTEFPNQTNPNGLEHQVVDVLHVANRQLKESTDVGKEMVEAREQLKRMLEEDDLGYESANEAYYYATRDPKDFLDNYDLTDDEKAIFERFISAQENFKSAEGIPLDTQRHLKDIAIKADDIGRKIQKIESERIAEEDKHLTKWDDYKLDGGENYREILFKMPNSTYTNQAMQTHWSGSVADGKGVLAHARIQDFNIDGKKMLFIEEIQSDWHNQGHKIGYDGVSRDKELSNARKRYRELEKEHNDIWERLKSQDVTKLSSEEKESLSNYAMSRSGEIIEEQEALKRKFGMSVTTLIEDVPDAPFRDNYHEYVLKRLIRMVAEQGYDSIGWTPADIQMDRWNPDRKTNAEMDIKDAKNPNAIAFEEAYVNEYDRNIKKFMAQQGKKWGAKVGRTPMEIDGQTETTYYVDDSGNRSNSYNKLIDGILARHGINEQEFNDYSAVFVDDETIRIKDPKNGKYFDEEIHRITELSSVWSMPITDSMKESVLYEGQARYALADDGIPDLVDLWENAKKKYGTIPKGEKPVRDIDVPRKISEKDVVSQFARTMIEAGVTPDEAVSEFEKSILDGTMTHEVITNKKASAWARQQIEHLGFKEALNKWTVLSDSGKVGKKEFALGMELYNQCITNKDVRNAMKIAAELVAEATNAGQTLQSTRMLKLMTPDGQLYYLEKSIQKMNEEFKEKLGDKYKDIELDEGLMEEFLNEKDEEKRDAVYDKICQNIADQIPATKLDKWNAWRYLAMLGNPRTHIRNVLGNAVFVPSVRLKTYIGAVLEKVAKVNTSDRTKSLRKSKESLEFAKKDVENKDVKRMLGGENAKYATTSDIGGKRTIFKTKWLEGLRNKNFEWLEKEDTWFLKSHYVDALARLITARKIDVNSITPKQLATMRTYAVKEAWAATYRDANALADGLNALQKKLERSDKKVIRASSALIEGVMPFKKTPMNIAKQGLNYSPLGILKGVYNAVAKLKKGNATVTDVIDDLSKGLSGTMILLLGYFFASMGWLDGDEDKTQKEKEFDKMTGEQSYALKIGDFSYTIDWATPSNLSLFIGSKLYDLTKDDFSFADITSALSTVTEPLLELSVFSGLNGVIESAQYSDSSPIVAIASDMITSYMTQALPTIGGQISRIIDDNKREYYYVDKNKDVPQGLQRLIGQASSKVPLASYLFEPAIDEWGREETYGGVTERVLENTVSPGYYSPESYTRVDKKLRDLYEKTGDASVLPVIQQKYFTEDYKKYNMSAEDYTKVKKLRGKKSFELVSELFADEKVFKNQEKVYSNMTDQEKINAISKCYKEAGEYAKEQMIDRVKRKSK